MKGIQTVKRKRGNLVFLGVEIDASQYKRFSELCEKLDMTKVDAVSAAINIWMNMVAGTPKE